MKDQDLSPADPKHCDVCNMSFSWLYLVSTRSRLFLPCLLKMKKSGINTKHQNITRCGVCPSTNSERDPKVQDSSIMLDRLLPNKRRWRDTHESSFPDSLLKLWSKRSMLCSVLRLSQRYRRLQKNALCPSTTKWSQNSIERSKMITQGARLSASEPFQFSALPGEPVCDDMEVCVQLHNKIYITECSEIDLRRRTLPINKNLLKVESSISFPKKPTSQALLPKALSS